jgi:HlyD family secretion protein
MSPTLQPSAPPQPSPLGTGPRTVTPEHPLAPDRRRWLIALLLLVAAVAGAAWLRSRSPSKPSPIAAVRTVKASRGQLMNTLRLTGSIAATRYSDVVGPRLQSPDHGRSMSLIYLSENGRAVRKGEKVAELDGQDAKDHVVEVESQVQQARLEILRQQAAQAAQMETVRQRVRSALGTLERARQDLLAAPTKNKIDQELLKLAVEEAEAAYQAAEAQVALYEESQACSQRIMEFNYQGQLRHLNRHQHDIDQLVMVSPMDGTAIMRPTYRHGEQFLVRSGDEVSPGQTFMRVVDTSAMHLETTMNQAESELVRQGQPALIRFDAYPQIKLNGKVIAVGTIASGGRRVSYYIRRVPVRIAIQDHDPRVLPDLTASADVVLAESPDSVIVPRQAVVEEDGHPVVYVKQGDAFTPREVELGMASNTEVTIRSGLQAGEEVALDRPL